MKAWLVEQGAAGAGHRYLLDPFRQTLLSVGRSAHCDIVVNDQRTSRHHSDIRWTGRQWEVVDRGSTNGTFVNGARVQRAVALGLGDSVSIGSTTLTLAQYIPATHEQAVAKLTPVAAEQRDVMKALTPARESGRQPVFWLAQALVVISILCLVAGAFLPWFRVTGSLTRDMEPLIQGIAEVISSFTGEDLISVTQEIRGFQGFGKFSVGIAFVCLVMLIVDVSVLRRSVVPGIIYLLAGLGALGVMLSDLLGLRDTIDQLQSMTLLFGIELADVIEAFGRFIEVEITLLPGTYLTLLGLGCLLLGGIARLLALLVGRDRRE